MAWLDELKKITRPYDDDDEFIDEEESEEEYPDYPEESSAPEEYDEPSPSPVRNVFSKKEREPKYAAPAPQPEKARMKLVLSNPQTFEEAAQIADHLKEHQAVLMNLESATKDVSRRLLDFMSGAAFALGGKIKRVSAQAYIITPTNVSLVGDSVEDFENSGLYF